MGRRLQPILLWASLFLSLFGACFLALFAVDVFALRLSFRETVVAFFIRLIPSALILLALALSWRRPAPGGLLFLVLALVYIVWAREPWAKSLVIAGPLLLIGVLFLLGWVITDRS